MCAALAGDSPEDGLDAAAPPRVHPSSTPATGAAAATTVGIQAGVDHNSTSSAPRHRRPRPHYCVCQASHTSGEIHSSGHPSATGGGLSTREVLQQNTGETLETGGVPTRSLHDQQQTTCPRCEGVLRSYNSNSSTSGLSVSQQESAMNSGLSGGGGGAWSLQRAMGAGMAAWGGRGGWLGALRSRPRSTSNSG